jgi:hypothetical protein
VNTDQPVEHKPEITGEVVRDDLRDEYVPRFP